ncbi:Tubulin polyglutamylase ttll5 [Pleodorina starrii]|nr:Tubulin polyglutamylase ttll5 [Pleodorina starrii]
MQQPARQPPPALPQPPRAPAARAEGPYSPPAQQPQASPPSQGYRLKPSSRALLQRRRGEQAARVAAEEEDQDAGGAQPQPPPETFFRFWHDEKRFKGSGADSLVQRALAAAGGRRTGGHEKSDPSHGPLGWQRLGSWDVLWSPASTALQAASQGLRRHQLVCALPGSQSLSRKRRLPETLSEAYGPSGAASLIPLSFQLPGQLAEWRAWMAAHPCPPGQQQRLWMLKTSQHLGKGLQLVTQEDALAAVLRRQAQVLSYIKDRQQQQPQGRQAAAAAGAASEGSGGNSGSGISISGSKAGKRLDPHQPRPFVLAQLYVSDPLLINDRKFGIRLWVVAVGADPLRAYLHKNGLVLFATEPYDAAAATTDTAAAAVDGRLCSSGAERAGGAEEEGDEGEEEEEEQPLLDWEVHSDAEKGDVGVPPPSPPPPPLRPAAVAASRGSSASVGKPTPPTAAAAAAGQSPPASPPAAPPAPPPGSPSAPLGHVTNYAQNVDGEVWDLRQLGEHLGRERFSLLYRRILRSAALTVAAALPHIRSEASRVRLPGAAPGAGGGGGGGAFELFGLDYLVDTALRPWLLEVNATPSLAVQHSDPRVCGLIREQKEGMVADMVALLNLERRFRSRQRTHGGGGGDSGDDSGDGDDDGDGEQQLRELLQATYPEVFYDSGLLESLSAVEAELAARGSFMPLMPLFPLQAAKQPAKAAARDDRSATSSMLASSRGLGSGDKASGSRRSDVQAVRQGLDPVPESLSPTSSAAVASGSGPGVQLEPGVCTLPGSGDGFKDGEEKGQGEGQGEGEGAYLLDAAPLPAGCGGGLRWSTADRLSTRERSALFASETAAVRLAVQSRYLYMLVYLQRTGASPQLKAD